MENSELDGRIVTSEDTKLFRVTGIVAILDSPFYDFSQTKWTITNPTKIKDTNRKTVGFANVFIQNNKLVAECSLEYNMPERLDIEAQTGIYLVPNGLMVPDTVTGTLDLYGMQKRILKVVVTSLLLTHKRPRDTRLGPLGSLELI